MLLRALPALAVIFGFFLGSEPTHAACTDAAVPGVDWRRCVLDNRDLQGIGISGARLRDASFVRTDLSGSDLSGVDGFRAKFMSAKLANVRFDGARLSEADLTKADLTGASFKGADLRRARLFRAILRGADLTDARMKGADLFEADLSGAIWIDGQKLCAEGSIGQCN